jgi:hypothetical protein
MADSDTLIVDLQQVANLRHTISILSLGNDVRGNLDHGTHMGVLPTSMIGSDRIASVITLRRRAP